MKQVTIEKVNESYYLVRATTDRFGKNEVMFEGINFNECLKYVTVNDALDNLSINTETFEKYELVYLIENVGVGVANKMGCTPTSIGKITNVASDTNTYEVVEKTMKHSTNKWTKRKNKEQIADGLNILFWRLSQIV